MSPRDWKLYIPENDCGIKDGYYSMNEVVGLLRLCSALHKRSYVEHGIMLR
jgi:hypothetical protein